ERDDLAGGDEAAVGDVVSAEGGAAFPQIEARACKIAAMRQGIHVVIHARVTLKLGEVILWGILFIERNAQTPQETLRRPSQRLLGERLGPAVKTARGLAKGKIGIIQLGE